MTFFFNIEIMTYRLTRALQLNLSKFLFFFLNIEMMIYYIDSDFATYLAKLLTQIMDSAGFKNFVILNYFLFNDIRTKINA